MSTISNAKRTNQWKPTLAFTLGLAVISALLFAALIPAAPVSADSGTMVQISGKVTGYLGAPCNCQAGVTLVANLRGESTSLEGSGTGHSSTGATNQFDLTGSIDGTLVTLSGTVVQSTAWYLVGSPVLIVADVETGALTFTLSPVNGPYINQTLIFTGSGNVLVIGE